MNKETFSQVMSMIVGGDRVSVDEPVLWAQSESRMPIPPVKPDGIVLPRTVDEIVRILAYANQEKISVYTVAAGDADYGGSVPILEKGILMDFSQMNRIWEVNDSELYVVIEPGVTIGQLQKELAKHDLTFFIPSAPHTTSVMTTFVPQQGIGTWPNKYGGNETFVRGVEVVLATGEVVRTGSGAFQHRFWHHRNNLGADLTGLFVGAHGTTGIITKAAIGVVPAPEAVETEFQDYDTIEDASKHIRHIGRKEMADYMSGQNFMLSLACIDRYPYDRLDGRTALSKEELEERRIEHGIPNYWFHLSIAGTEKIVRAKKEALDEYTEKEGINVRTETGGDMWAYVREQQGYSRTTGIGSRLANWRGGRMTFHSYAPPSKWIDLVEPGVEILRKHGLECGITLKAVGPHIYSSQLRFVSWFNEEHPYEKKMVRGAWKDIVDHLMKNGCTIFRHQIDMEHVAQYEPEFYDLLKKIKHLLDPNRILNPGMLAL